MSTENTSSVRSVESLRAALSVAQTLVVQLESALAAAEESAATVAVLAMVESEVEAVPAEPEVFFNDGHNFGPSLVTARHAIGGVPSQGEFSGSFSGYIRAYAGSLSDGCAYHWTAFLWGKAVVSPSGGGCANFGSWADAVKWLRAEYAKYSVDAGVVVAAAA